MLFVLLGTGFYAVWMSYHTILQHREFGTSALDLGTYNTMFFNALQRRRRGVARVGATFGDEGCGAAAREVSGRRRVRTFQRLCSHLTPARVNGDRLSVIAAGRRPPKKARALRGTIWANRAGS